MASTVLLNLISPVVAIMVALWGFRRSTRADKLRAFFEIQSRYLANDVREGRRSLHKSVAGRSATDIAKVDHATLSNAGYALAVMNSIAVACESGYTSEELVRRSMGRSFVSAMSAATPYIDYIERIRGYRPYSFAERLAAEFSKSDLDGMQG